MQLLLCFSDMFLLKIELVISFYLTHFICWQSDKKLTFTRDSFEMCESKSRILFQSQETPVLVAR